MLCLFKDCPGMYSLANETRRFLFFLLNAERRASFSEKHLAGFHLWVPFQHSDTSRALVLSKEGNFTKVGSIANKRGSPTCVTFSWWLLLCVIDIWSCHRGTYAQCSVHNLLLSILVQQLIAKKLVKHILLLWGWRSWIFPLQSLVSLLDQDAASPWRLTVNNNAGIDSAKTRDLYQHTFLLTNSRTGSCTNCIITNKTHVHLNTQHLFHVRSPIRHYSLMNFCFSFSWNVAISFYHITTTHQTNPSTPTPHPPTHSLQTAFQSDATDWDE